MTSTDDIDLRPRLWNPSTRCWDGPRLHAAIIARSLTVREFAKLARISAAVIYKAIKGGRTTDATTIAIFDVLDRRQPRMVVYERA